jgi:hypothetical protein
MTQVDFFVVGAPKCGTTSLNRYLCDHKDIVMSSPKETNYFSSEELLKQSLFYKEKVIQTERDYMECFSDAEEKVLGDGSVSYLFYPGVAEKLHNYNPEARIIVLLRDPVERAFSHYLMDSRIGYVNVGFEEIFRNKDQYKLFYQQYFELSEYSSQVKRYIDIFGTDQVLVLHDVELRNDPEGVLVNLSRFLAVDPFESIEVGRAHNEYKMANNWLISKMYKVYYLRRLVQKILPRKVVSAAKKVFFNADTKPVMQRDFELELREYYRCGIEDLAVIIGKDFPRAWLGQ